MAVRHGEGQAEEGRRGDRMNFITQAEAEAYLKAERALEKRLIADDPWRWPGVYVITSDANKAVKIGRSRNPASRLQNLQVSHLDDVRIFWCARLKDKGAVTLEGTFHKLCRGTKYHLRGEWYSISPFVAVKTLKAMAARLGLELHQDLQFGYERGL